MKRLFFITTALALALSVNAKTERYALNVENFSELQVVDGINVEYACNPDSAGWVVYECEPEMASCITFSNIKNKLSIQTTAEEQPYVGLPTVRVYSQALQKVTNSGDSTLTVNSCVPVNKFSVRQIGNGNLVVKHIAAKKIDVSIATGNGNVHINGTANSGKLSNVGTGHIYADDLVIDKATCWVLGSGSIYCSPVENLKIFGAGSGKVVYTTAPEKVQNRSIGVKSMAMLKDVAPSSSDKYLSDNK